MMDEMGDVAEGVNFAEERKAKESLGSAVAGQGGVVGRLARMRWEKWGSAAAVRPAALMEERSRRSGKGRVVSMAPTP